MNAIERAKNIITSPNKEWDVIALEQPNTGQIIMGYVLLLAGAAAVAAFIGYGLIGFNFGLFHYATTSWGIYYALRVLSCRDPGSIYQCTGNRCSCSQLRIRKKYGPLCPISRLFLYSCMDRGFVVNLPASCNSRGN